MRPSSYEGRMQFQPIGFIKSCYQDKFGTPRQPGLVPHSRAWIHFEKIWQPEISLQGLEQYSHLWVIFHFHQNGNERFHAKVHPPRMNGESIGVFATRSPHRPNPIGLSLVKIESIRDGILEISGVDLIEGTPVLDIKPYLPSVEAISEAQSGWTTAASNERASIEWSSEALKKLREWETKSGKNLQALIEETVSLDPRPLVYKGFEGEDSKYRQNHAIRLYDGDIHFVFKGAGVVMIEKVLWPL